MRFFLKILRDRRGATAVEYGFILALVTLAVIVGIRGVANATTEKWNLVAEKVTHG